MKKSSITATAFLTALIILIFQVAAQCQRTEQLAAITQAVTHELPRTKPACLLDFKASHHEANLTDLKNTFLPT